MNNETCIICNVIVRGEFQKIKIFGFSRLIKMKKKIKNGKSILLLLVDKLLHELMF